MNNLKQTKVKTYDIVICGSGGNFTLGEIPTKIANDWAGMSQDELGPYLSMSKNRGKDYRDSANIACEVGLDEIDKVKIYSASGEELMAFQEEELNIVSLERTEMMDQWNGCALFTRTMDEGHLVYRLETTTDFDPDKLRFLRVNVGVMYVVNRVFYERKELDCIEYFERCGELKARIIYN